MGISFDSDIYAPPAPPEGSVDAGTTTDEKPTAPEATVPPADVHLGAWAASLALKGIEKVKDGFRAADALSKKSGGKSAAEVERLRAINLAAVEVWEVYNKEGEKIEGDNATGVFGHTVGFADHLLRDDGKTIHDDRAEKWALERSLVAEIKKMIASGEADTLREALNLIRSYGPVSLRASAKRFLEDKCEHGHLKGYPLWELVDFASRPDKKPETAHDLLERAFELEYDADAVETPFAVYSLVHAVSTDPTVRGKAEKGMKALAGESDFGRAAAKFVFSSSPEGAAVDVGLMVASAGLGTLAKLKTVAKLKKAGVTGYKAVALGKAAEITTETTALWALNAGREALTHDVGKALDPEHLAKSLAATGLMVGLIKVFNAAGGGIAKRLGVSKSIVGHGAGLAGMISATKAGGALGLHDAPVGGANESLAHDIFGYVKFAVAHKVARLFVGKPSVAGGRKPTEVVVKGVEIKGMEETVPDAIPEDVTAVARPVSPGSKGTTTEAVPAAARRKISFAAEARPAAKAFELTGDDGKAVALLHRGLFYKLVDMGSVRLSLYADAKRGFYTVSEVDTAETIRTAGDTKTKMSVKVRRAGEKEFDVPIAARGKSPIGLRDGDALEVWSEGAKFKSYTFRSGTSKYSHLKPGSVAVLPLKDIVPTQEVVFGAQVEAYASGMPPSGLPEVRVIGGVPYVADGHHRLYAAYRSGAKDVFVRVYDPAGDPPDLVPTLPERATVWDKIVVRPSARVFHPGPP